MPDTQLLRDWAATHGRPRARLSLDPLADALIEAQRYRDARAQTEIQNTMNLRRIQEDERRARENEEILREGQDYNQSRIAQKSFADAAEEIRSGRKEYGESMIKGQRVQSPDQIAPGGVGIYEQKRPRPEAPDWSSMPEAPAAPGPSEFAFGPQETPELEAAKRLQAQDPAAYEQQQSQAADKMDEYKARQAEMSAAEMDLERRNRMADLLGPDLVQVRRNRKGELMELGRLNPREMVLAESERLKTQMEAIKKQYMAQTSKPYQQAEIERYMSGVMAQLDSPDVPAGKDPSLFASQVRTGIEAALRNKEAQILGARRVGLSEKMFQDSIGARENSQIMSEARYSSETAKGARMLHESWTKLKNKIARLRNTNLGAKEREDLRGELDAELAKATQGQGLLTDQDRANFGIAGSQSTIDAIGSQINHWFSSGLSDAEVKTIIARIDAGEELSRTGWHKYLTGMKQQAYTMIPGQDPMARRQMFKATALGAGVRKEEWDAIPVQADEPYQAAPSSGGMRSGSRRSSSTTEKKTFSLDD